MRRHCNRRRNLKDQYGQREETTPTASAGKLASLLSIIKKQKELKDHQESAASTSILGDGPPQHHHHHHQQIYQSHQSHNPVPLLSSPPRGSERRQSPQKRTSDNGYDHRDAYDNEDRKRGAPPLLPEPPAAAALAPGGHVRRDFEAAGSNEERYDSSRAVKKPRGSRWGPPKAATAAEEMRPPPINTIIPRPGDASRSPPRRPDYQPGMDRATPTGLIYPPGRINEWQPQQQGQPLPSSSSSVESTVGGRVGFGFERDAFHDNNRYAPPASAPPTAPYARPPPTVVGLIAPGRHEDRATTPQHSAHSSTGGPSEKIPGTSGQICRKFIASRCTFGDRCWYDNLAMKPEIGGIVSGIGGLMYVYRNSLLLFVNTVGLGTFTTSNKDRCSDDLVPRRLKRDARPCSAPISQEARVALEPTAGTQSILFFFPFEQSDNFT